MALIVNAPVSGVLTAPLIEAASRALGTRARLPETRDHVSLWIGGRPGELILVGLRGFLA